MKKNPPLLLMALICLFAISLTAITVSRYSTEETAPPFDLSLKPREYEPVTISYHDEAAYTLHEDGTLEIKDYFCAEDPDTAPLMKWYETVAIADAGFTNQQVDDADRYPNAGKVNKLVIPGTVKVIGATAFMTYNLDEITLEEGVETVSVFAFANLGKLTNFYLPKSLTSFTGIQNPYALENYTVHADNPNFYAVDGVLFSKNTDILIQFPVKWGTAHDSSVYTVPAETKSIQGNAFSRHDIVAVITNLTSASGTTGNWGSSSLIVINNQLGAEITAATLVDGVYTLTTNLGDSYIDPHVGVTNTADASYSVPVINDTVTMYADWYGSDRRVTLTLNIRYGYGVLDADGNLKLYNRSEIVSGGTLYALPDYNAPADSNAWTALDKSAVTTVEAVDEMIPSAMNGWFSGMKNCLRMDLTKLDTRSCTDMTALFQNCAMLNSIFVGSKWDVGNVAASSGMFTGCATGSHDTVQATALMGGSGTYFDGNTTDKTLAVIDGKDGADGLLTDGENARGYAVYCAGQNAMLFFRNTAKPVPGDTLTVEGKSYTVSEVFEGIENIAYHFTDLDDFLLPEWAMEAFGVISDPSAPAARVQSVTEVIVAEAIYPRSLTTWFAAFSAVTELNLQNISLDNVTEMLMTFEMTASLVTLHMPTSLGPNISNLSGLFVQDNLGSNIPSALKTITGIDQWDTSNVGSLSAMFYGCSSLISIDLSSWKIDLDGVGGTDNMFNGCSSLQYLKLFEADFTKWWTSPIVSNMFQGCSSLEELDLSSFQSTNAKDLNLLDCFAGMSSLKTLRLPAFKLVPVKSDPNDPSTNISDPTPLPPFTTEVSWYNDNGEVFTGADMLVAERSGSTCYYLGSPLTLTTDGSFTASLTAGGYSVGYAITLSGDSVPEAITVTVNGVETEVTQYYDNVLVILGTFQKSDVIHIAAAEEPPEIVSSTSDVTIISAVKDTNGNYTVSTSGRVYALAIITSSDRLHFRVQHFCGQ